jgi:hypothetical protein
LPPRRPIGLARWCLETEKPATIKSDLRRVPGCIRVPIRGHRVEIPVQRALVDESSIHPAKGAAMAHAPHELPGSGTTTHARAVSTVMVLLLVGVGLMARQAAPAGGAALTLSIKGSTVYAKPEPVPLQTALLVVTPVWEDVPLKVSVTGSRQTAAGTPLFGSDLVVVFSNRAADCGTVFQAPTPSSDRDFMIAAGQAIVYEAAKGWPTTPIGKTFADPEKTPARSVIDKFSVEAQYMAQKKQALSKDNLRGNDGKLILEQTGGHWTADFSLHSGDVSAEGRIPVTLCPIGSRKQAAGAPLLGLKRLNTLAENY